MPQRRKMRTRVGGVLNNKCLKSVSVIDSSHVGGLVPRVHRPTLSDTRKKKLHSLSFEKGVRSWRHISVIIQVVNTWASSNKVFFLLFSGASLFYCPYLSSCSHQCRLFVCVHACGRVCCVCCVFVSSNFRVQLNLGLEGCVCVRVTDRQTGRGKGGNSTVMFHVGATVGEEVVIYFFRSRQRQKNNNNNKR